MSPIEIKSEILRLTREYSRLMHAANRPGDDANRPLYVAGDGIPYAGRVFTEDEVEACVSTTLDFWLTLGPEGEAMERELAEFMGVKHCLLVNSGSSANLVAFSALTTHKLPAHKRKNSRGFSPDPGRASRILRRGSTKRALSDFRVQRPSTSSRNT